MSTAFGPRSSTARLGTGIFSSSLLPVGRPPVSLSQCAASEAKALKEQVASTEAQVWTLEESRLDIVSVCVDAGWREVGEACTSLGRETWRCVPAGLDADEAARVRIGHAIWRSIINAPHGKLGHTRLIEAAARGDVARVRDLCNWHARVDARDAFGLTALHTAAAEGHALVVTELIARGANVNALAGSGRHKSTPLIEALANGGGQDVVQALLKAGASTRIGGSEEWTVRRWAVHTRDEDILAMIDAAA